MIKKTILIFLILLMFPNISFAGNIPWKKIYPNTMVQKFNNANCIAGFYAKSIPEYSSSWWLFFIPNQWASGTGHIALLDTNNDGYNQPIPMPGIPVDDYSLQFGYNGWSYAFVRNIGVKKISYKFLVRKPCLK